MMQRRRWAALALATACAGCQTTGGQQPSTTVSFDEAKRETE